MTKRFNDLSEDVQPFFLINFCAGFPFVPENVKLIFEKENPTIDINLSGTNVQASISNILFWDEFKKFFIQYLKDYRL